MALRTFKFVLKCINTSGTHELVVEAHTFPQAASEVYVEAHKLRAGKNEWRIVSAIDETSRIGEN